MNEEIETSQGRVRFLHFWGWSYLEKAVSDIEFKDIMLWSDVTEDFRKLELFHPAVQAEVLRDIKEWSEKQDYSTYE